MSPTAGELVVCVFIRIGKPVICGGFVLADPCAEFALSLPDLSIALTT